MANKLEVSFNSPQCGWMSIGFDDGTREFHTTTAHAPHSRALSELLKILSDLADENSANGEYILQWNRNPEEFDFRFIKDGENVSLEIYQYPNEERESKERELVYSHNGKVADICQTFAETFNQLYADRETDEFEFNWRQPFPFEEYENFQERVKIMDNKMRCQSCGMPLSEEFGNFGKNADGTYNEEYCSGCFADGGFTQPNQTMEEMIESSIENMTSDLNMPVEKATTLANSFIPTLRRWQ